MIASPAESQEMHLLQYLTGFVQVGIFARDEIAPFCPQLGIDICRSGRSGSVV